MAEPWGFSHPGFLPQPIDPYEKKEDPTQRSTGEMLSDVAVKLIVDPALSVGRAITSAGRAATDDPSLPPEQQGRGFWTGADKALGEAQEWAQKDALSPYQQQTDRSRWFPGPDEPSAWRRPWGKVTSEFLPSVLGIAGTALAPYVGIPARLAAAGATTGAVAMGAGEMTAQMRDYADRTPLPELQKSEVFQNAWRANNGDEKAAREQFFRDTVDIPGIVANAIANGIEFSVISKTMLPAQKEIARAWYRRLAKGTAEGATSGFGEGAAGEFGEQGQKIRAGVQDDYDVGKIIGAGTEAAVSFAPAVGALETFRRGPPKPGEKKPDDGGKSGLGKDAEQAATLQLEGAHPGQKRLPYFPGPQTAMGTNPPQIADQRFNLPEQGAPPQGAGPNPAVLGPVVMPPERQIPFRPYGENEVIPMGGTPPEPMPGGVPQRWIDQLPPPGMPVRPQIGPQAPGTPPGTPPPPAPPPGAPPPPGGGSVPPPVTPGGGAAAAPATPRALATTTPPIAGAAPPVVAPTAAPPVAPPAAAPPGQALATTTPPVAAVPAAPPPPAATPQQRMAVAQMKPGDRMQVQQGASWRLLGTSNHPDTLGAMTVRYDDGRTATLPFERVVSEAAQRGGQIVPRAVADAQERRAAERATPVAPTPTAPVPQGTGTLADNPVLQQLRQRLGAPRVGPIPTSELPQTAPARVTTPPPPAVPAVRRGTEPVEPPIPAPRQGTGPMAREVRGAVLPREETGVEIETTSSHQTKLRDDIRQLHVQQSGLSDEQFAARRQQLETRARRLDRALINQGGDPFWERSLPKARVAEATPQQKVDAAINQLLPHSYAVDGGLMTKEEFNALPQVQEALQAFSAINDDLFKREKRTIPLPTWLYRKLATVEMPRASGETHAEYVDRRKRQKLDQAAYDSAAEAARFARRVAEKQARGENLDATDLTDLTTAYQRAANRAAQDTPLQKQQRERPVYTPNLIQRAVAELQRIQERNANLQQRGRREDIEGPPGEAEALVRRGIEKTKQEREAILAGKPVENVGAPPLKPGEALARQGAGSMEPPRTYAVAIRKSVAEQRRRERARTELPGMFDLFDRITAAIQKVDTREGNVERKAKQREHLYDQRDEVVKAAIEGMINKHFGSMDGFDKTMNDMLEGVRAGGPRQDADFPVFPQILKSPKRKGAARGKQLGTPGTKDFRPFGNIPLGQQTRTGARAAELKPMTEAQRKRAEDEQAARELYQREVRRFFNRRLSALDIADSKIAPFIRDVVDTINAQGRRIVEEKTGKPGTRYGEVPFVLPTGSEDVTGETTRYGAGKAELDDLERLAYWNYATTLQRFLAQIEAAQKKLEGKQPLDMMRKPQQRQQLSGILRTFAEEARLGAFFGKNIAAGTPEEVNRWMRAKSGEIYEARAPKATDLREAGEEGSLEVSAVDRAGNVPLTAEAQTPEQLLMQAEEQAAEEIRQRGLQEMTQERHEMGSRPQPSASLTKAPLHPALAQELKEIPIKWSTPEAQKAAQEAEGKKRFGPERGQPRGDTEAERSSDLFHAREQLSTPQPEHPLISEPETATDTIERVKAHIAKGLTDMSPFVSSRFLDKLSKIIGDVKVVHTWNKVTGNRALYQTQFDRIVLPQDSGAYAADAVHEMVHAATEYLLNNDPEFRAEIENLRARAEAYAQRTGMDLTQKDLYGLEDAHEFIAEARSNAKFRQFLNRVPTPGAATIGGKIKNALNAVYRTIQKAWHKVMGGPDGDTALDVLFADQSTVLGRIDMFTERSIDQMTLEGRRSTSFDGTGRQISMTERYGPARERVAEAMKDVGSYGLNKLDRIREAWRRRDREQGYGMALKSTFDVAFARDPTMREKATAVRDVMAKSFAERQKIMREQDDPVISKIVTWYRKLDKTTREKVGAFLFDETFHGADASVGLNHALNSHLHKKDTGQFNPTLANWQIYREHKAMRERYDDLTKIKGFVEHRKAAHEFFRNRENEIRTTVARTYLNNMDVIPETYIGKDRERIAEGLRKWVFERPATKEGQDRLAAALLRRGVDVHERKTREDLRAIRNEEVFRHIPGPYLPLTRHGDYAVSGTFHFPLAFNAERPPETLHWQTGKPIDDGTYLFDNEADAKKYIEFVSKNFGATLLTAGQHYYDTSTGKRARLLTEEQAQNLLAVETKQNPTPRNRLLRKQEVEAKQSRGETGIKTKYFVRFQPQVLEFHQGQYEADQSLRDWQKKAAEWKKEHGRDVLEIYGPEDVKKGDERQNEQFVSAQFQTLIDRFENSRAYRNMDEEEQRAAKRALTLAAAKTTMHRGIRQRFQPRGYVQGASNDLPRTISDYSAQSAGYLAKMRFQPEANEVSKAMTDYVEAMRGSKQNLLNQRISEEMLRRLHAPTENHLDNFWGRNTDRLLKVTMFDKLFSAAYFMINATEPMVVAMPLLMKNNTNPFAAASEMARAYRLAGLVNFAKLGGKDVWTAMNKRMDYTQYAQEFAKLVKGQKDGGDLDKMLSAIGAQGLFEGAAGVEVQRSFLAPDNKFDAINEWTSNVFQGANTAVENLNRFVTAVTTYRLAKKRGLNHEAAVRETIDLMYEANGQYANFNAPPIFNAGPIGRMAFQFKKYPQRILANYFRAVVGSVTGNEKLAHARQLTAMLVMQGAVAGLLGMPTEPFSVGVNAAFMLGLSPYNWDDAQAGIRQMLTRSFGKEMGEILAHGGLRMFGGPDFAGRLGQENMIAFGSPGSAKVQDIWASAAGLIFGAPGSTARDVVAGVQNLMKGARAGWDGADAAAWKHTREGLKQIIPLRVASDVFDAISRREPEGMESQSGRKMREPYTLGESIVKGLGFTPRREAESIEARHDVKRSGELYNQERKRWLDLWTQSPPAEQQRLWPAIQAWNRQWDRSQVLTRSQLMKAEQARGKAKSQDPEMLGLSLSKQTKPFLGRSEAYNLGR